MIMTVFEVLMIAAIFIGFKYEDRLVAFEEKVGKAIKRRLRGE
jgi:hypothetical protein